MESDLQMWKLQHTKEDKTDLNCLKALRAESKRVKLAYTSKNDFT